MHRCGALFIFVWEVLLLAYVATYDNLAFKKSAWQRSTYLNYWANRAVDGRYTRLDVAGGQCAISGNNKDTAEWRVNLRNIFSIHHIFIQYMTYGLLWDENNQYAGRFLGFSVYISNRTNKEDGVLCFRDTNYTNATIPNPVNITCPYHGRYVIYYNNRTHLPYPEGYSDYAYNDLCELEVHGCKTAGYYGETCTFECPHNCQEGLCHITEGNCLGCLPGYYGAKCDKECDGNTYGLECNITCGNCIHKEQCDHVTGSCANGCDAGFHGDKCDIACSPGWYGVNCSQECGPNCIPSCDRFYGVCELDCIPGWRGDKCDMPCDDRMYGVNCSEECGACLDNEACHHINGSCINGCDKGYHGQKCDQECTEGYYGNNCARNCSLTCGVPGRCDRITGSCNATCLPGWKGSMCENECDGNTYGGDCGEECGECVNDEQCHHINGTCLNGCDRGFQGLGCNQGCPRGVFGINCLKSCSVHCQVPMECNRVTGHCFNGCQSGWGDPTCNTKVELLYVKDEEDNMCSAFYGTLVPLILSVIFNCFCAMRMIRQTECCRRRNQRTQNEVSFPKTSNASGEIYDQVEEMGGYQELEEVSKQTIYEKIK
uniref:Multiple epidermal growth factor-like domains protein 10 isoform X1 n=1 Tax=Crassostrea virginica TaxID=6565 RepID=A0A8B8BVS9_CRAVI|nr:multiple epidermal growth factor-like domains protein 10 isoform X1 [Crassostrea virginica]